MFYVLSDGGIEEEFETFSEADAYIEESGCAEDLWVESDEDDYESSYNEDEGFDPYEGCCTWDC